MSGKRRSWRSKKAEKESQRLEREIADNEAKARSNSEKRQGRIKKLWTLITSAKLTPKDDESEDAARNLTSEIEEDVFGEWTTVKKGESEKGFRRRDRRDARQRRYSNELVLSLVELVDLQKAEIEHMRRFHQLCEWAKSHAPEKLDSIESGYFRDLVEGFSRLNPGLKLTAKQRSELERQRYNWRDVGLIEYEFGGKGEAEWRKYPWAGLSSSPYQPTCLDDIFAGGAVHMHGLQRLFGMHRNRLAKYLRRFKNARSGRETLYYYRAVVAIMRGLLGEKPQERKAPVRGSPLKVWPSDPDLRTPVLRAIEARLNSLSVEEHIKTAFLTVIHRHLPDSAKK